MTKIYAILLGVCLGFTLLAGNTGCMVQPVDSVTGAKLGGPVSALHPTPTTSPAGNPVVLQKTNDVDAEAVQQGIQTGSAFLPAPWNVIVAAAGGAAAATYLKKKKTAAQ